MDPTAFGPIGWGDCFASEAAESCCQPRGPDDTYARLNRTGSSVFGYTDFMRVAVDAAGQRVTLKASARSTAGTYVPIVTHDYC